MRVRRVRSVLKHLSTWLGKPYKPYKLVKLKVRLRAVHVMVPLTQETLLVLSYHQK